MDEREAQMSGDAEWQVLDKRKKKKYPDHDLPNGSMNNCEMHPDVSKTRWTTL